MQNQQPSTLKEIRVHGTQDFPCAFYQTGTRIKGNMVKHHWHEEVELLYFSGGEFCLEVNMERFNISEECFYFINPGELHSISVEKNGGCEWFIKAFNDKNFIDALKKTAAVWKMRWFFIWIC